MTREDKLYSMTGLTLIKIADDLGVKVNCNRTRTQLKESKAKVIEKILAAENAAAAEAEETEELEEVMAEEDKLPEASEEEKEDTPELVPMPGADKLKDLKDEQPLKPKRGALIEWNGKSQNICKWGEELGISANTLYGRIYKMGWPVEKAFTKKPR